ncbi:MAG: chemotaxis protein CheW [Coriobacteriia bacterium]|nr:chemotaxis protein CheW [Coriobacteriia bacterium]
MSPRAARKQAAKSDEARPEAPEPIAASPEPLPVEVAIEGLDRILLFVMDEQRYGLPIEVVQEIQQIVALSEIPDDSGGVVGVINLRGVVVPVMDLRLMLGLVPKEYHLQTPMVFTRTPRGLIALVVDEVADVVEVPSGSVQAPSGVLALADRLLGVCRLEDGPVFVLDVDRLVPARAGRVVRP